MRVVGGGLWLVRPADLRGATCTVQQQYLLLCPSKHESSISQQQRRLAICRAVFNRVWVISLGLQQQKHVRLIRPMFVLLFTECLYGIVGHSSAAELKLYAIRRCPFQRGTVRHIALKRN